MYQISKIFRLRRLSAPQAPFFRLIELNFFGKNTKFVIFRTKNTRKGAKFRKFFACGAYRHRRHHYFSIIKTKFFYFLLNNLLISSPELLKKVMSVEKYDNYWNKWLFINFSLCLKMSDFWPQNLIFRLLFSDFYNFELETLYYSHRFCANTYEHRVYRV